MKTVSGIKKPLPPETMIAPVLLLTNTRPELAVTLATCPALQRPDSDIDLSGELELPPTVHVKVSEASGTAGELSPGE